MFSQQVTSSHPVNNKQLLNFFSYFYALIEASTCQEFRLKV